MTAQEEAICGMLRVFGINPADTYRVDVGVDQMTVYQYDRKGGRFYHDGQGVAVKQPFTVRWSKPRRTNHPDAAVYDNVRLVGE